MLCSALLALVHRRGYGHARRHEPWLMPHDLTRLQLLQTYTDPWPSPAAADPPPWPRFYVRASKTDMMPCHAMPCQTKQKPSPGRNPNGPW